MNIFCRNDKCKFYFEDFCVNGMEDKTVSISEHGLCETFKKGNNKLYEDMESKIGNGNLSDEPYDICP